MKNNPVNQLGLKIMLLVMLLIGVILCINISSAKIYEQYLPYTLDTVHLFSTRDWWQNFTIGTVGSNENILLSQIGLHLKKDGTGVTTMNINIVNSSGKIIGTNSTFNHAGITDGWYNISMNGINLTRSSMYYIFLNTTGGDGVGNQIEVYRDTSGTYIGGEMYYSNGFLGAKNSYGASHDMNFLVIGEKDCTNYLCLFTENSQSYNAIATETTTETFTINITYNNTIYNSIITNLLYNNTLYTGTQSGTSENIRFSTSVGMPSVAISSNKDFKWLFTLTNSSGSFYSNSSLNTQTISPIFFGICNASYNVSYINFTVKSAENPFPNINATFKSTWDIKIGSGTIIKKVNYEDLTEKNHTFNFCVYPTSQNITVNAKIEYDGSLYARNFYYLHDALLTNTTSLINLHLLNESKATATILKVVDTSQQPLEGITYQIQLFDVGTGTYYTIGMAMSDFKGEDISYLNWYDSLYKFILTQNGDIVKITNTTRISSTPVIFNIETTTTFAFDKFRDFVYSLYFDNSTKNFVLTFTKPSGLVDQGCLRVIKRSSYNDTEICLTCESSSSATLFCNIASSGNGTFIAHFYATGSFFDIEWIMETVGGTFADTIYDLLGNDDATFYALIFSGITTTMFFIHPIFGIVGLLLGLIGGSALGFQPINYIILIGITLVGGFIIWILKR